MSKLIDMTGQTFGRLTVIERAPSPGPARWIVECECGHRRPVVGIYLRTGQTSACGTACVHAAGRRPWPVNPQYLVGEDGSIAGPRGGLLAPWTTDTGYHQVHVNVGGVRKGRTVHIIVCETFHGPRPPGMEVAHTNGDKFDNRASNLSWKTRPDNHADKIRHGTAQRGESAANHKLTEVQVKEIRALAAQGLTYYAIGCRYGITRSHIGVIVRRECWSHI